MVDHEARCMRVWQGVCMLLLDSAVLLWLVHSTVTTVWESSVYSIGVPTV